MVVLWPHVTAAATLTKEGSRLVAILPVGMKGKDILPYWDIEWSDEISNEFAGTSISVVILTAKREMLPMPIVAISSSIKIGLTQFSTAARCRHGAR